MFGAWSMKLLPWAPAIEHDLDWVLEAVASGERQQIGRAVELMYRITAQRCHVH
jgi:hypothetical protein